MSVLESVISIHIISKKDCSSKLKLENTVVMGKSSEEFDIAQSRSTTCRDIFLHLPQ